MLIRQFDKILALMSVTTFSVVRTAYVQRVRVEHDRINALRSYMESKGYQEELPGIMTDDGRPIVPALGKAWALKPEVHAKRLAEAMGRVKQRDAAVAVAASQQPATPPTTCTTLIDGQLCGGTLIHATVCPRCALGKSGVAATLTCDVCGHVAAIMREAK